MTLSVIQIYSALNLERVTPDSGAEQQGPWQCCCVPQRAHALLQFPMSALKLRETSHVHHVRR
jgi:hypothetical protein